MDFLKSTGELIRERRIELGISRAQLAEKIGRKKRCIGYYEHGEKNMPITVLLDICKALDLEVMILRGRN